MLQKLFHTIFYALVFFVINFCNPVYRVRYEYSSLTKDSEKMCALQCENTKLQCEQLADMKQQQCKSQESAEKAEASKNKQMYIGAGCPKDATCTINYNRCFQTCGGKVTEIEECTANCDKVPPEERVKIKSGGTTTTTPTKK